MAKTKSEVKDEILNKISEMISEVKCCEDIQTLARAFADVTQKDDLESISKIFYSSTSNTPSTSIQAPFGLNAPENNEKEENNA